MDIAGGLGPPTDLMKENNIDKIGLIFGIIGFLILATLIILGILSEHKTKKCQETKINKNSKCPICREPSETRLGEPRQDKLCPCHAAMLRDDQIALCKYCGSWYNTNETCKCRKLD